MAAPKIIGAARNLDGQALWMSCALIFVFSFVLRTSLVLWTGQYRTMEIPEPASVAQSIVQQNVFGNPYRVSTGPTAHTAPFVPYLLSVVYRLFGIGPRAQLVQALLSTAACSFQYALLPVLATCVGWPARVGTLAGLFGALFPFRFWLETKGTFEHTYAALALLLIAMMTATVWRSKRFSLWSAIWRGVVWAVAFHISASLLSVCALLFIVEMAKIRTEKFSRRVMYLATAAGASLLLLVPWTARNYIRFGKLFYMRDNLGLELAVSNRDDASPLIDQNMRSPLYRHPNGSTVEALKVRQEGEIAYNQERMREARRWVQTHPVSFIRLTLKRIWYFWFPPMQRTWQTAIYGLLTILGFCGAWIAIRRDQMAIWLILPLWVAYPLIYYLIETSVRYRYPIDWSVLVLASYAVTFWWMQEKWPEQEQLPAS